MKAQSIYLFLAAAGLGSGATPPVQTPAPPSQPLSFEANQGQTDAAVKFFSRGGGYALFLTRDSAVFKLRPLQPGESPAVVRMKLAGANRDANISGADALPGTVPVMPISA